MIRDSLEEYYQGEISFFAMTSFTPEEIMSGLMSGIVSLENASLLKVLSFQL